MYEKYKMCDFFSFLSDGKGNVFYLNWEQRKELSIHDPAYYNSDDYNKIADYHEIEVNSCNKYRYNPLLGTFSIIQLNGNDDSSEIEEWLETIDLNKIVKPLKVKHIINPLLVKNDLTEQNEKDFEKWVGLYEDNKPDLISEVEVWNVWNVFENSIRISASKLVSVFVWETVRHSVKITWESISDLIWRTTRDDNIIDSARAQFYSYLSSFIDMEYDYDFSPGIRLWTRGFIPLKYRDKWVLISGYEYKNSPSYTHPKPLCENIVHSQ